jgi:hypothetical protein
VRHPESCSTNLGWLKAIQNHGMFTTYQLVIRPDFASEIHSPWLPGLMPGARQSSWRPFASWVGWLPAIAP